MFITNYPMWQHFYGDEEARVERETEFFVPDNQADLKAMIAEFKGSQPTGSRRSQRRGSGPPEPPSFEHTTQYNED